MADYRTAKPHLMLDTEYIQVCQRSGAELGAEDRVAEQHLPAVTVALKRLEAHHQTHRLVLV